MKEAETQTNQPNQNFQQNLQDLQPAQNLQDLQIAQNLQNLQNLQNNCNCRKRDECPLNGNCQEKEVIYQATVKSEGVPDENYIGLTAGTFKKRFDGHNSNFRSKEVKGTTLSKYIWKLKDDGKIFEIDWKIICNAKPFSPVNEQCALCTAEKFYIIFKPELATLNKRNELGAHCKHKQMVLLDKT